MAFADSIKPVWDRLAFPLAFTTLVIAFVIGQIAAQPDYRTLLQDLMPDHELERLTPEDAEGGQIVFRDKTDDTYIVISEAEGYGGPLAVGVRMSVIEEGSDDPAAQREGATAGKGTARVVELLDVHNKETPAFVRKMEKKHFFRQFGGKIISDDFLLDSDIDAVSGATISSRAYAGAVGEAAHVAATAHFGLTTSWAEEELVFGINEIGLIAVFVFAFVVSYATGTIARIGKWAMPVVSLAFVGIYTNSSVSIGQMAGILMGYIPDPRTHMLWWIMMAGMFGSVILVGRNIYCGQVCPFQYVQRGLNLISGVNLAVRPGVQKSARMVVGWMTWASLMLIFLSAHPTIGAYEPFALMFSLTGIGLQWYILPLSLLGSLFVLNFWCRLFCPVGLVLNESVRLRKSTLKRISSGGPGAGGAAAAEPEDKGDLWRNES